MDRITIDLAQAVRGLRANKGYACVAVLTLAIGIGATASVFNLAHWLLLRPVPGVQDAGRLMSMSLMAPDRSGAGLVSYPEFDAMRTGVPALAGLAGYQDAQLNVAVEGGSPRRLRAAVVSGTYFDVLGGPLAFGRGFTAEEGHSPGATPATVVGYSFWVNSMGRRPDVLGRTITINGGEFTVVGVAAEGFRGPSRAGETELWVPVAQHKYVLPMFRSTLLTDARMSVFFSLIGRMHDGATVALVEQQANSVRAATGGGRRANWVMVAREGIESTPWMHERVVRLVWALTAAVGLLLVLTCANVGNLILARATGRRVEVATRLALGASRGSVARLLLAESVVLSVMAGGLALLMTWSLGRALDGAVILPGVVTLGEVTLDWQVFLFAFGIALVVAVIAGVTPAITAARVPPHLSMREGGRGLAGSGRRVRQVLTIAQVAVSVTLLLGAALLVRSMQARFSIPVGFDPSRVLSLSIEPALQRYTPERTDAVYRDVMARIRAVPGVRHAGLAWLQPFSQGASDSSLRAEGAAADSILSANHNIVSPGFLEAMGVPLIEGRDFTEAEFLTRETPGNGVVIITASLARRLFNGGSAVGRRVTMSYPEGLVRTVVGVIPDQRQHRLMDEHPDLILEPFGQSFTSGSAAVQVAITAPAAVVIAGIREALRQVDPTLPVYQVQTLDAALRRTMGEELLVSQCVAVFAGLAMLLAAVGLAAVLARTVAERTREFAVRVACGATPGRVAAQVTREALTLSVMGVVTGLVMSAWFVRFISARLYGVAATDPWSVALVAGAVIVVTLMAAAIPSRRASGIDPASVLR